MRVLRISHSAVVSAWRERERELRRQGVDARLLSALVWNEGGTDVRFAAGEDDFAEGVRTLGTHPNLFLFDPRPVWRALRAGRWDVVDIHEEPCSLAVAEVLLLRRLAAVRAPVVLYSAQNIDKRYPRPFRWFERAALHRASGVSVCNRDAGRIVRRKGLRGIVAPVPLGVDLTAFAPRGGGPPEPRGPVRVGYVGRLEHRKGVGVAIEAIARDERLHLDVVGSGPGEARFREQAAAPAVTGRVRFRGALSGAELAAAYRGFDLLVVPSLPTPEWLEQFGRVAVEAMASGVPVVASRSGALPDVVGDAGVLVEPGDPVALAAAIDEVVRDRDRWRELRRRGLARARGFAWAAVAREMIGLYRRVGGDDRPVPPDAGDRPLEVLVVAYGSPDKLARAVAPLAGRLPITIVDNGSSAETAELAERFGARYLDPGANLGFAGGVNAALDHGVDPLADVLLLNPDARIDAGGVARLHAALAGAADIAAVAPAQADDDGTEAIVQWPFPSPRRAVLEAVGLGRIGWTGDFLIGSILLMRREAIDEVGRFDERFFLYAEETDWQKRARDLGWDLRLVPTVRGRHEGAGAQVDPGWREAQFTASLELYLRKHHGRWGWAVFRAAGAAGAAARSLVLRGPARARARRRARLYLRGPVRVNDSAERPGSAGPHGNR